MVQIIVLNGGSSAGKSSIARCLQMILPTPFLSLGVDTLIDAMPSALWGAAEGIEVGPNGEITIGPVFRALEAAWRHGVAAMARAGARIIFDGVCLGGAVEQARARTMLAGLSVLWVGVRCDARVAAAREAARGDRVLGMAALQAALAHRGLVYDMEVDTTHASSEACARDIAARVMAAR